jgi:hypothetical protein
MKHREFLAVGIAIIGMVGIVEAADKADPTGTWKWTITMNDQKRDATLKLKLERDKLTGTMLGRNNQETNIDNAVFKDGEVTFSVTRERNNMKVTTKYKGKLDGDTIKGTTETDRDGQSRSREWEAKRE